MESNLTGTQWKFEYFDVYASDINNFDRHTNGILIRHLIGIGNITFNADFTGTIIDSLSRPTNFRWTISDGVIKFTFPASANVPNANPLIFYGFSSTYYICNDDVTYYNVLRSDKDLQVFRFRLGGSCNEEQFHCIEWAISR